MEKDIITDTLRKLSYKNISIDTTKGRDTIVNELLKVSKPVYVYESPDDGNTIYRASFNHKAETPGLGAEIKEAFFEEAFVQSSVSNSKSSPSALYSLILLRKVRILIPNVFAA